MALVTCPCAFRLRRLAQTARRDLGARHVSCKCAHCNGSCDRSMCMSTAQACTKSVRSAVLKLLACSIFIANSCINGLLWRSCLISSKRSSHDRVQVLNRRPCGDFGGVLSKRSLHEVLADAMSWRCLWKLLWQQQILLWQPCEILFGVLAWSSWPRSCGDPSGVILYTSFWAALEEVLKPTRCPYMIWYRSLTVFVRRSCGYLVEILVKRSLQ